MGLVLKEQAGSGDVAALATFLPVLMNRRAASSALYGDQTGALQTLPFKRQIVDVY